ncbi:MAG: hypothetical protein HQ570_04205 [Candidatus Omnitrophica bacterium]|nr:hypothetical protein [Candidatus Omnitrophota bacterium]
MKKMIGFLIVSCFCLSMVVFATDGFSNVGEKMRSFSEGFQKGVAGLSKGALEILVDEVIRISLEEYEREFSDLPDYTAISEEEKETGRQEVMNLLKVKPELLEKAKDENGEVNPVKLVEILNNQGKEDLEIR